MSGEVDHASDRTVARYSSLDKKVELLIERMSECVRFVREYMQDRTPEQQLGECITRIDLIVSKHETYI